MRWYWCALLCQLGLWLALDSQPWASGLFAVGALFCCIRAAGRLRGVELCVALLSLQFGLLRLVEALALRRPELPLGRLTAGLLQLAGHDAAGAGPAVWVGGVVHIVQPENLLLGCFVLVAVCGGLGLWGSGRRRPRTHLAWLIALAVYAPVRLAAMLALGQPPVWWADLTGLAPPLLALAWLDRGALRPTAPRGRPALLFAAGLALLLLAWHAPDHGTRKGGRILIDEGHSRWEPVEIPLDTRRHGLATVYTFQALQRSLARHFASARVLRKPLDDRSLARCDVLMLKTPTRAYAGAEVEAVVRFVERGGGLWLVGEHTNVFGTSTYLNPIARRFGIRFRADAAIDPTGRRPPQRRPSWFAHPAVAHMPPLPDAISCSLALSGAARPALVGHGLVSDAADYSRRNYFAPLARQPRQVRRLARMATATLGRGRVAAFGDSTQLSSYAYHLPGVEELALSTVDWLDRSSFHVWPRLAAAALGLLLATAGLLARPGLSAAASAGWLGLALSAALHGALLRTWYPPPLPHTPGIRAALVRTGGFELSLQPAPETSGNLLSLLVALQRLQLVPRVNATLDRALEAELVVLANPRGEPDIGALQRYLRRGGRLLLLLDREQPWVERLRGHGRLAVLGPPHELDDRHLGNPGDRPTAARLARYRRFYRLMREQLGLGGS